MNNRQLVYNIVFRHSSDNSEGILATFENIKDARQYLKSIAREWSEHYPYTQLFESHLRVTQKHKLFSRAVTIRIECITQEIDYRVIK